MQSQVIVQDKARSLTNRDRFLVLLGYILILYLVNGSVTSGWIPSGGGEGLWLLSGIALFSFAFLSTPFFVRPADALASAMAGGILLWSIDMRDINTAGDALNLFRWLAVSGMFAVSLSAISATMLHKKSTGAAASLLGHISYKFSSIFGAGAVVFTPPALISVFGFHQDQVLSMLSLGFVWFVLVTTKPLELVALFLNDVARFRASSSSAEIVGQIQRIDSPNIIRVSLDKSELWNPKKVLVTCLADASRVLVLPLFSQVQNDGLVGTGLFIRGDHDIKYDVSPGSVCAMEELPIRADVVKTLTGITVEAELIGFIVEESRISSVRFEIASTVPVEEGVLVCCRQGDDIVYYQVLDARTAEESFAGNPRGKHLVTAAHLGVINNEGGFSRYPWLP